MNAIFTRRSIRKFSGEPVSDDQIGLVLKAGMAAPSAGNSQPWHFIVVRDKRKLTEIGTTENNARMCKEADVAICVCADPALEKYPGRWMLDCSAAIQNILLMVTELGLGAVWCGIYPVQNCMDSFRKLLAIPDDIQPVAIIPIGRPGEQPGMADRFKADRIHSESW